MSWPKASEGGRIAGKKEIRVYWTRQWAEFDPSVEPVEVFEVEAGRTEVRVRQREKSLEGRILADGEVWHVSTIAGGLIERMDIRESEPGSHERASAAFSRACRRERNGGMRELRVESFRVEIRTWGRRASSCRVTGTGS